MEYIKLITGNEDQWCKRMGYRNPYLDPYDHHITSTTVTGDHAAYRKFPENRHVYDKLWIAQTQGMKCGRLEQLKGKENNVNYPIFIKPRWGHLSASSKNCFKIKDASSLSQYTDYPDMMWSEFVDGTEGMTDFLLSNGRIVWHVTYVYSDEQNGFTDVWKYISPDTPAPRHIEKWVIDNVNDHTGFVNVQYRKDKIIEAGLRPARSGMYIIGADCPALSRNIYNVMDRGFWDESLENKITWQPYYAFKCFSHIPPLYVWPQHMVDIIVQSLTDMPLYEYYFEPVNNEGVVFFQFMHKDFDKGMMSKKAIEFAFAVSQLLTICIGILITYMLFYMNNKYKYIIAAIAFAVWLTRFLNPLYVNYNCVKAYKQMFMGQESLTSQEEFDKKTREIQNGAEDIW